MQRYDQLISYIAPGAPATRRPATGQEPFFRAEVGFTPRWYHRHLGIDFGERWHTDPAYRRSALVAMGRELKRRFGDRNIGWVEDPETPRDLLTGVFGACPVAGIYGLPIVYVPDQWPTTAHRYLTDEEVDRLEPPDLDVNPFFSELMAQVAWIENRLGPVEGFLNWQGVLNNAYRLRGEEIFMDMVLEPERSRHLFMCVAQTMTEAAQRLYARQREGGIVVEHFTVSNCLVNMVSAQQYEALLLPFDVRFAEEFGLLGVHNCAWTADPYLEPYARIPHVGYIDMGWDSDLRRARELFPLARRAIMVTPMDLAEMPLPQLERRFEVIADTYAPCDLVLADIDWGTPDERVIAALDQCKRLSARWAEKDR